MRDRLAAKSVEGMEMRLQQMSSSQRERLAAWNAEEREIRLQHDREPQGAASAPTQEPGNDSVLYKPRCKNSMHKWLHWRCPLLTESFACHSSPGLTLVLGTLIPFVISVFFICPCMATSISDHNLRSCHCSNSIMHVYCALAQARPTMPCICLV